MWMATAKSCAFLCAHYYAAMARSSDVGYDSLYNDAAFNASRRLTRGTRPALWSNSTSEMRRHVDYGKQGIESLSDSEGHFKFVNSRMPAQSRLQALYPHVSAPRLRQSVAQYRAAARAPALTARAMRGSMPSGAMPSADARQWKWQDATA